MNKLTQTVIIIAAIGLGFAVWHFKAQLPFIGSESTAAASKSFKRPPQDVIATEFVFRTLPRIITAVGTARANESVDITSKITGKILKLDFTEGQKVKAGSLLVQMDDTELRANLAESEAERDNRQKLYDRALKLYASKNIPKAQVDLLLSELQASEAKIMADKARISDYQIRAPFAGKLGLREVSLGSLVRPADVITTLDDTDTIKVDFDLPESFLAEIDSGQAFHAKTVAYPDRVFEGFVETIATRINPATRSVRVRGVVPNKNGLMKPGMFLAVELQISLDTDVPMLAEEALVTTVNGHYVYAILEDKAIRSPVKIGRRVRGFVEIVDGLDKGAVVITEGLQKVKDGSSVNVTIVTPEVAVEATQ